MKSSFSRVFIAPAAIAVLAVFGFFSGVRAQAEDVPAAPEPLMVELPEAEALPPDTYHRGRVVEVVSSKDGVEFGEPITEQVLRVEITSGPEAGKQIELDYQVRGASARERTLEEGSRVVVVGRAETDGTRSYYLAEVYRLPAVYLILGFFFLLAVIFAGKRGFMSILGLAVTLAIIALYTIPQITGGSSPLFVSFVSAIGIASSSLFLAHGWNKRTAVAFVSILITIGIALVLAKTFVNISWLNGLGSEEAFYLQSAPIGAINLRGLLLGAIVIGVLGVLDDVTTAQSAAVDELSRANPNLSVSELYRRGSSVGKEHITSLVNTLVLAYLGASFPLVLLFNVYDTPLWVTLNSEIIVEEVVRTLVGSVTLIFAVPVTTLLAAAVFARPENEIRS